MRSQTFWTVFHLASILAWGLFLVTLSFAQQAPEFAVLKGRWVRPDGGYVIEIRGVDAGGRLQAAYYNPKPITVSRAEATRLGEAVAVFIELRAPGYPGSTYTLVHDPESDQLQGIYHHAGLQENFEVVFVRDK
jgi:hypothetical protein